MKSYIQRKAPGLFDYDNRLTELTRQGDLLQRLDQVIDWDLFVPTIETALATQPQGPGGRPAWPPKMMFKLLVLQRLYHLSDEQTEYQLLDRLSFQRFAGLTLADKAPDQNTVYDFREALTRADLFDHLFALFGEQLAHQGLLPKEGHIVDATFVEVPRQRNTREENAQIKAGQVPPAWEEQPHKRCHKDLDARWTKKGEAVYYGYKDHVKVNAASKLIEAAEVTDAAVHDSQAVEDLVAAGDGPTYADSAYSGEPVAEHLAEKGVEGRIIEPARRGRELTARQQRSNRTKSRVRARGEHVFSVLSGQAGRVFLRYIGFVRNRAAVVLLNLVYNFVGYEQITRLRLRPV